MRDNSHIRISHFFSLRISCYRIPCSLKIFKYGNYHNFQLLLTKPVLHPKQSPKEEDKCWKVKTYNRTQTFLRLPILSTRYTRYHAISTHCLQTIYTLVQVGTDFNLADGILTVPVSGVYMISVHVLPAANKGPCINDAMCFWTLFLKRDMNQILAMSPWRHYI